MTVQINGPGKYDELCTMARELSQARGCFVVIIGGNRGDGFSGQLTGDLVATVDVPALLRSMADQIEGRR